MIFLVSARGGEAGAAFRWLALGGEAGGEVVLTVSGCFTRLVVVAGAGTATGGTEAPARVFLTDNGVTTAVGAVFRVTRPLDKSNGTLSRACDSALVVE